MAIAAGEALTPPGGRRGREMGALLHARRPHRPTTDRSIDLHLLLRLLKLEVYFRLPRRICLASVAIVSMVWQMPADFTACVSCELDQAAL